MGWLGTWKYRYKLTISRTLVDDTLTDFPILIKLYDSSGVGNLDTSFAFSVIDDYSKRKKIAVTSSDGETQLYVEIVNWDVFNQVAILYVKMPTIYDSAETYLYFYFDSDQDDNDSYVGDKESAPAMSVWSIYNMVQHLNEDAATFKDSTDGNHDSDTGTNYPTIQSTKYSIPGQLFNGTDDVVLIPHNAELIPSEITIDLFFSIEEKWINFVVDSSPYTSVTIPLTMYAAYFANFEGIELDNGGMFFIGTYYSASSTISEKMVLVSIDWEAGTCTVEDSVDISGTKYWYPAICWICKLSNNRAYILHGAGTPAEWIVDFSSGSIIEGTHNTSGIPLINTSGFGEVGTDCFIGLYFNYTGYTWYAYLYRCTSGTSITKTSLSLHAVSGTLGPGTAAYGTGAGVAKVSETTALIITPARVSTSTRYLYGTLVSFNLTTGSFTKIINSVIIATIDNGEINMAAAPVGENKALIVYIQNIYQYYIRARLVTTDGTTTITAGTEYKVTHPLNVGFTYTLECVDPDNQIFSLVAGNAGYSYRMYIIQVNEDDSISFYPSTFTSNYGSNIKGNNYPNYLLYNENNTIRKAAVPIGVGPVIQKDYTGSVVNGYDVSVDSDKTLIATVGDGVNSQEVTGGVLSGTYHTMFTIDSSYTAKLYQNGTLVTTEASVPFGTTGTMNLLLGNDGSSTFFSGFLGQVKIANFAMDASAAKVSYLSLFDILAEYDEIETMTTLDVPVFFSTYKQNLTNFYCTFLYLWKEITENAKFPMQASFEEKNNVRARMMVGGLGSWIDAMLNLDTTGPTKEDTPFYMDTVKTILRDVPLPLAAFLRSLTDCAVFQETVNRAMPDFVFDMEAAGYDKQDAGSFLQTVGFAVPSVVMQLFAWYQYTEDAGISVETILGQYIDSKILCSAINRIVLGDTLLKLAAVKEPPAFVAAVFQKLISSVSIQYPTDLQSASMNLEAKE